MIEVPKNRAPNYCPFCGAHWVNGGAGDRHGSLVCAKCHAEYQVEYFRTYPPSGYEQAVCDDEYAKHRQRYDGQRQISD